MRVVDRRGHITSDCWTLIGDDTPIPAAGPVIVSLARWLDELVDLDSGERQWGMRIGPDDDLEHVAPALNRLALIALDFPSFTDGRAYSNARILRERMQFDGELRAVGDIQRDQAFYLVRCGFDTLMVPDGVDPEGLRRGLEDFSLVYQYAADARNPIRRLRGMK